MLCQTPLQRLICCCLFVAFIAISCVTLSRRHISTASDKASPSNLVEANASPRVSLNHATRAELETLPGIGPALAARIIEHRERFGPFRRAEHLIMVRGFSDRRFRQLRAMLTVE